MAVINKDKGNSISSRLNYIDKQLNDPRKSEKEIKVLKLREQNLLDMLNDGQETFEDGGKVKKSKKYKGPLPKSKPTKVERLLNKRVKGEKGPYIPKIGDLNEMGPMIIDTKTGKQVKRLNKGGGLNAAIDRVKKTQGMEKGGAAFPDLTGDGKVTQKDILKGRGVDLKQEGGAVRGMGRAYMGASRKAKIR